MSRARNRQRSTSWAAATLLTLTFALPASARGESPDGDLSAAEHAYEEVDFPAVQKLATRALERGTAALDELGRLHVLLGIALAAQGDAEQAKLEFVAALALQPSLHLDRTLAPKIRGPYLEAQGFWGAHPDRLLLTSQGSAGARTLLLGLVDPAHLVDKLSLRVRAHGSERYASSSLPALRTQAVEIDESVRSSGYDYTVRASDRFGNTLYELGSDAQPLAIARPDLSRSHAEPPVATPPPPGAHRSYWAPALLGIAGLGAAGAGVYFNLRREHFAKEWNGPECEAPGMTRGQQCDSVDSDRQRSQTLAIGLYAGAGALVTTSLIVLLSGHADSQPSRAGLSCGGGLPWSLGCAGRF
jgi:hypothetical protein